MAEGKKGRKIGRERNRPRSKRKPAITRVNVARRARKEAKKALYAYEKRIQRHLKARHAQGSACSDACEVVGRMREEHGKRKQRFETYDRDYKTISKGY